MLDEIGGAYCIVLGGWEVLDWRASRQSGLPGWKARQACGRKKYIEQETPRPTSPRRAMQRPQGSVRSKG